MSSSGKTVSRQNVPSRIITNGKPDVKSRFECAKFGLQGESLVIPPSPHSASSGFQSSTTSKTTVRNSASTVVPTSTSTVSSTNQQERDDWKRQISESLLREKRLKSQFEKLQEELKATRESLESVKLTAKSDQKTIENLQIEFNRYKKLYEAEKKEHEDTRTLLQIEQELAERLRTEKRLAEEQHVEKVIEMDQNHSRVLVNLEEKHGVIIKQKEETIDRMKRQMAEAFTDNSWERQTQIEQLQKEVMRLQEQVNDAETIKGKKLNRK